MLGYGGDAFFFSWTGRALLNNHFKPNLDQLNWPTGFNIFLSDSPLSSYMLAILNTFLSPNMSYSLLAMALIYTNILLANKLFSILGFPLLQRILFAILIGSLPGVTSRLAGHLPYLSLAPILICFIMIIRKNKNEQLIESKRMLLKTLPFSILLILSMYWSIYDFVIVTAVLVIFKMKTNLIPTYKLKEFFFNFSFFMLSTLPLLIPKLVLLFSEKLSDQNTGNMTADYVRLGKLNSLDVTSLIFPQQGLRYSSLSQFLGNAPASQWTLEKNVYIGVPLILLFILSFLVKKFRNIYLMQPMQITAITMVIISLGAAPTFNGVSLGFPAIWSSLFELPGLVNFRAPGRFFQLSSCIYVIIAALIFRSLKTNMIKFLVSGSLIFTLFSIQIAVPWFGPREEFSNTQKQDLRNYIANETIINVPTLCTGDTSILGSIDDANTKLIGCFGPTSSLPWYSRFKKEKNSKILASLRCIPYQFGYALAPEKLNLFPMDTPLPDDWTSQISKDFGATRVIIDKKYLDITECRNLKSVLGKWEIENSTKILFENSRWKVLSVN